VQHHPPTIQETEPELESAAVLFKGNYQRIFKYILSMVRDTAEAADLTQETFLRAYDRRAPMESQTDLDEIDVAEPDTPSLQQTLEQDEMSECVQRYLNSLSASYRAVILLYDMHELTAPEIAQLLRESLPTIKIRLHRARLKLRAALKAGCDFSYDERNVLTCESKD
jgi:DNA-directed RNA polymerase specialized sigma24 family protein